MKGLYILDTILQIKILMETIMNPLLIRLLQMAALLSLFNVALARDILLEIETGLNPVINEAQPVTDNEQDSAVDHGDILEGDILEIETTTRATSQSQMKRELIDIRLPARGMSKAEVEKEFGRPVQIRPPVGEPPISSWRYNEFTVYFEHDWVLHGVLNRKE